MAVIDIQGRWHGRAAGLVYRSVGGRNIVQGRPRKFKQTVATRESGLEFGLASNTARIMREVLWPAYHSIDKGMVNRFTSTVLKSIRGCQELGRGERDLHNGDLSYLQGFQFNKNSPLSEVLPGRPEVIICDDGKPELHLPSFTLGYDVKCPMRDYKGLKVRFMATAFHFRSEYYEYLDCRDVWVDSGFRLSEQVWKVEKELPPGSLILLTVSLFAVATKKFSDMMLNSKEWSPGEIVYAMQVPQGDAEVLEREYIDGNGRDGSPERPVIERTGSPFEKMPLGSYSGRDIFWKFRRLWEKEAEREEKKTAADEARHKKWLERLQQKQQQTLSGLDTHQLEETELKPEEPQNRQVCEGKAGMVGTPVLPRGKIKFGKKQK